MALTVGDVLAFSATVKDAAGALANAGTMTLTVTLPNGTPAVGSPFTVTPTSTGIYDKDVTTTLAGRYVGYWLATGVNSGAHTQVFDVRSSVDTALMSLDDAKDHLNIPLATTTHDEELQGWLESITRLVEHKAGQVVVATVADERHDAGRSLWLHRPPVISLTSVVPWLTTGTTYAVADLRVSPSGRVERKDGQPFTGGPLAVTYIAGRQVVPANIRDAAKVILKGMWETQRGASGLPLQAGDELLVSAGLTPVLARAAQLLEPDAVLAGFA